MCPCDSTSAGFWAWKSGWLKSMLQQQQYAIGSAHLNQGHSACRSAFSVKPLSSRIFFIPLKNPGISGWSSWKSKFWGSPFGSTPLHILHFPCFPGQCFRNFGNMSCWECIIGLLLVPRCIVEAKIHHSNSREVTLQELNSFFSLCTQISTVKVAIC